MEGASWSNICRAWRERQHETVTVCVRTGDLPASIVTDVYIPTDSIVYINIFVYIYSIFPTRGYT